MSSTQPKGNPKNEKKPVYGVKSATLAPVKIGAASTANRSRSTTPAIRSPARTKQVASATKRNAATKLSAPAPKKAKLPNAADKKVKLTPYDPKEDCEVIAHDEERSENSHDGDLEDFVCADESQSCASEPEIDDDVFAAKRKQLDAKYKRKKAARLAQQK